MLTPPIERDALCRLVPHGGAMCLLDRALAWDTQRILCETGQHAAPGNPLRRDGLLPAVCGLEFAFQAMALHGALTAARDGAPRPQPAGFVGGLREVTIAAGRLDDVPGPLRVAAEALVAEAHGAIYRFEIAAADGRALLCGQASIIVPVAA